MNPSEEFLRKTVDHERDAKGSTNVRVARAATNRVLKVSGAVMDAADIVVHTAKHDGKEVRVGADAWETLVQAVNALRPFSAVEWWR